MNIFLINHYAGSPKMGMEYRPYYLAKEWVKMGHAVSILVANYSHIRTINPVLKKDIEPENPVAISEAIKKMKHLLEDKLKEMGTKGRSFVLQNHDYKILAKKFISIFESIKN